MEIKIGMRVKLIEKEGTHPSQKDRFGVVLPAPTRFLDMVFVKFDAGERQMYHISQLEPATVENDNLMFFHRWLAHETET